MDREFIKLVKEMRSAQKRFNLKNDWDAHARAVKLESEVDKYISDLLKSEHGQQETLF